MTEVALQISRGKNGIFNQWSWDNYPYGNITDLVATSHLTQKKSVASGLRPTREKQNSKTFRNI